MKLLSMNGEKTLDQLEDLAGRLGIKIRYEQFKKEGTFFPGGLCKLKGENVLIINSKAGIEDRIETLARVIISFDLSQVYIRPALRDFLSGYSSD